MVENHSRSSVCFFVPEQKSVLEEVNLPSSVIALIAGQSVWAETYPEEAPLTRRVEHDDTPLLIDPEGDC
jgi:hypothetical protein